MLFRSVFAAGLLATAFAAPVMEGGPLDDYTNPIISQIKKMDGIVKQLDKSIMAVKSDKISAAQKSNLRGPAANILTELGHVKTLIQSTHSKLQKDKSKNGKLSPQESGALSSTLLTGFVTDVKAGLSHAVAQAHYFKKGDRSEMLSNLQKEQSAGKQFNDELQKILPPSFAKTANDVYGTIDAAFNKAKKAYGG